MTQHKSTRFSEVPLSQLSPRGIIANYIQRAINETTLGIGSYSMNFAEKFLAMVPENQQRITVAHGGDACNDARANERQVVRWINGSYHLPVEAMLPLIAALPEPYQHQCRVELTRQLGSLFVPLDDAETTPTPEHFGELIAAAGECISAGFRIFGDNRLDHHDIPHIPEFLQQINELSSKLTSMNASLLRYWELEKSQK